MLKFREPSDKKSAAFLFSSSVQPSPSTLNQTRFKMKLLACSLLIAAGVATPHISKGNATSLACTKLLSTYPSEVFFPGDSNYTSENQRKAPCIPCIA